MGTTAVIGAKDKDGSVQAIHLARDGYPEEAGLKLVAYWASFSKVRQLLQLGNLEKLGEKPGEAHDIDAWPRPDGTEKWCRSYLRDLAPGASDAPSTEVGDFEDSATIYADVDEFLDDGWGFFDEWACLNGLICTKADSRTFTQIVRCRGT